RSRAWRGSRAGSGALGRSARWWTGRAVVRRSWGSSGGSSGDRLGGCGPGAVLDGILGEGHVRGLEGGLLGGQLVQGEVVGVGGVADGLAAEPAHVQGAGFG